MREFYSIFFLLIFTGFLSTPTFVACFDNAVDLSYIFSTTEEEQNSDERNFADKSPKLISKFFSFNFNFIEFLGNTTPDIHLNNWKTVYFELHSPPPEQA